MRKTTKALQQKTEKVSEDAQRVVVAPPRMDHALITLRGTAPFVGNRFPHGALETMRRNQELGQVARGKKVRVPKNFNELHKQHIHFSEQGWPGIPASAFRSALIDACRLVGYAMTKAKMSIFILADGLDQDDGQPLVRIYGDMRSFEMPVRLANGSADIAVRPQWLKWSVKLGIEWDCDQFDRSDVVNLTLRAGKQVGVGAGRPNSKTSHGMGWGTWEIST